MQSLQWIFPVGLSVHHPIKKKSSCQYLASCPSQTYRVGIYTIKTDLCACFYKGSGLNAGQDHIYSLITHLTVPEMCTEGLVKHYSLYYCLDHARHTWKAAMPAVVVPGIDVVAITQLACTHAHTTLSAWVFALSGTWRPCICMGVDSCSLTVQCTFLKLSSWDKLFMKIKKKLWQPFKGTVYMQCPGESTVVCIDTLDSTNFVP